MKATIIIESNGPHGVRIKCDPPVHKLKRMAQDGIGGPVLSIVGLTLKKLFESTPASVITMPGDDQAFTATNAQVVQAKKQEAVSNLLLPGRDF